MSDPITRHVQINGHQFRIWEKGTGEKIGFLAGIGGLTSWTPFLDHLAEESQVIVPSLPGFPGGSNLHTDLDNHLDWLIATHDLLTKSGLKGCHLIGASVGGSLAADAVALWPELANTLSLIAPFGLFDENEPVTDMAFYKTEQLGRNLGIDQVVGIGHCCGQDDKNSSYEYHAFADDPHQLRQSYFPMDQDFYD